MSLFWIDCNRGIEVSYEKLYEDIIAEGDNNIYIQNQNPYLVFLSLLRNLVSINKSIVLDADFSVAELTGMGISEESMSSNKYYQRNLILQFKSLEEIFDFYISNKNTLEIEIFTSGSSGQPKKVNQNLANVIRAVKSDGNYRDNIWGFAYNPTHFAGLQVFFQSLFNKNTLIYLFNYEYGLVYKMLYNYNVTHLSCTPTFVKMLIPHISKSLENVLSLTFGGEKFDSKVLSKIQEKFPNAKIKNVYASTEAGSILRTDGEYFLIPERYNQLIKIEENELLINKELLGKSDTFILDGDWYRTGDLVEFVDELKFRFLSRKSELINVGGYKVNPFEVENVIREVEGVKDVIVFGRENSIMGNIIVAKVLKEEKQEEKVLKKRILEEAYSQLQEYKTPRIINFVESFELTRTGKIKKI